MHTLSDSERDIIDTVIDLWRDHLRSHVHAGGRHLNTCFEINYHFYVVHQNICLNCQCNLTHLLAILWLILKGELVFTCIFGVSNFTR